MSDYPAIERRTFVPCPMHDALVTDIRDDLDKGEKRMDRFESKIDILIDRQAEQAIAIQKLNDAIGNGIKAEVSRTMKVVELMAEKIEAVCKFNDRRFANGDERLKKLEEFQWFRTWVTAFRDKIMFKILAIVFGVGALIGAVYLIEKGSGLLG